MEQTAVGVGPIKAVSSTKALSLLDLPLEVRLMIYEHLLVRSTSDALNTIHTTSFARILPAAPDYYHYERSTSSSSSSSPKTSYMLKIRSEDPISYDQRRADHRRTKFMVRSDRFRARCMRTTYHLLSNPSLHPSILAANRTIHSEAAETLFSSYTFDFDTHVEAIEPFFNDLTPFARSCVRGIRIIKRALPYDKEFDRAEWSSALSYIAENLQLRTLSLGVVAGKPGPDGWQLVEPYSEIDMSYLAEMDGMEWVKDLVAIKGLERLDVEAVIEHCPPPMSTAMARYIKFSASVEGSFAAFLQQRMVTAPQFSV